MRCIRAIIWSCLLLAPSTARAADPLSRTLRESYKTMKMFLVFSGDAMPEEYYGFKLAPTWRTFSDYLVHVAEANYISCSTLRVVPAPKVELSGTMSKAELMKWVKDSFDFCDPAFANMTDAKLLTQITSGERTLYPAEEAVALTNSLYEHYGNVACYMRIKGVTPPSTLRTQRVMK
jgi:hypothetical protein